MEDENVLRYGESGGKFSQLEKKKVPKGFFLSDDYVQLIFFIRRFFKSVKKKRIGNENKDNNSKTTK